MLLKICNHFNPSGHPNSTDPNIANLEYLNRCGIDFSNYNIYIYSGMERKHNLYSCYINNTDGIKIKKEIMEKKDSIINTRDNSGFVITNNYIVNTNDKLIAPIGGNPHVQGIFLFYLQKDIPTDRDFTHISYNILRIDITKDFDDNTLLLNHNTSYNSE